MRSLVYCLLMISLLVSCGGAESGNSSSVATLPALPATDTAAAATATVPSTTVPVPFYPSGTTTGLPSLDAIITGLLDEGRPLSDFVFFSTMGCTTADGLGGPPKCTEDQPDGSPVTALPILGPGEGAHFFPGDDVPLIFSGEPALYAVFVVPTGTPDTPDWPAGEHGLAFVGKQAGTVTDSVILVVDDRGVVRIDYSFHLVREVGAYSDTFLLPPLGPLDPAT